MGAKPFALGRLVATPGALESLSQARLMSLVSRHLRFDWGIVGRQDAASNVAATVDGSRIFSVYWIDESNHDAGKVWIITEAEGEDGLRESTCVLLPEEY